MQSDPLKRLSLAIAAPLVLIPSLAFSASAEGSPETDLAADSATETQAAESPSSPGETDLSNKQNTLKQKKRQAAKSGLLSQGTSQSPERNPAEFSAKFSTAPGDSPLAALASLVPELPELAPQDPTVAIAAPQLGASVTPGSSFVSPRRLLLRLSERRVYVVENNQVITSYPVGIGKAGWETPTGTFEITQKIPDPVWQHPWNGSLVPPGPNNPLGRHWIGFWSDGTNQIGFHGTIDESLIGQAVSHGCVRMRNADVAALFAQVEPGTVVTVEP